MCVGPHSGVMLGRAELQGLGGGVSASGLWQGSTGYKAQLRLFCPVQKRRSSLLARNWLRNTLGYPGDQEAYQVLGSVVQQQTPGDGGSWEAPSSMGGVEQVLSRSPQLCPSCRVSDAGPSASDAAFHLFGSLHAPADPLGSR